MSGFKLIAIRPLDGCDEEYRKLLQPNVIYQFYSDYRFLNVDGNLIEGGDVIDKIECSNSTPEKLYSIRWEKTKNTKTKILPINISAIVGENGSGKSTLFDLFYLSIYCLGFHLNMFESHNKELEKYLLKLDKKKKTEGIEEELSQLKKNIPKEKNIHENIIKGFKACLYYELEGVAYELKIDEGLDWSIRKQEDSKSSEEKRAFREIRIINLLKVGKSKKNKIKLERDHLDSFFYTIAINYSHYALNSKQIGGWVNPLFHKNDSYQAPLVINPMRTRGNIDINIENDLVKQRLMMNLLQPIGSIKPKESLRNIAEGKFVSKLKLTFNSKKIEAFKKRQSKIENGIEVVELFYYKYTNRNIDTQLRDQRDYIDTKSYLIHKLIKICTTYNRYREYYKNNRFEKLETLVKELIKDESHVTFKLKQATNFLRHQLFSDWSDARIYEKPIDVFATHIEEAMIDAKEDGVTLSTIELLPPSIFDIQIILEDGSDFEDMSSGEKQKIHSISTIVYHLMNLNSVFKNQDDKFNLATGLKKYRNINILFDEVEQYFHPHLQRSFIADLLKYLGKMNPVYLDEIDSLNFNFATHSPFILSDIPSSNILRLKNGKSQDQEQQTFGANIHDLLANDFFLSNGFMGEFAKDEINNVIEFLNQSRLNNLKFKNKTFLKEADDKEKKRINFELKRIKAELDKIGKVNDKYNKEYCKRIIELVGEPMLSMSLMELYTEAFESEKKEYIQNQITRLENLMINDSDPSK